MVSRRDILLQQLGITQWRLRVPTALQGEVALTLPPDTRLLLVADEPPDRDTPLLRDILHAMQLQLSQVCFLTPQYAAMLVSPVNCHCWCLDYADPIAVQGVVLRSPAWSSFSTDPVAKRDLWQQLCHYEHDFFPAARRFGARLSD